MVVKRPLRLARRPKARSVADAVGFDRLCVIAGLPKPISEYQFALHLGRKWAIDWVWVDYKLGLEVDGGAFVQGRHTRGAGFAADCVKLNTALVEGWRVLRCTPQQVRDGSAIDFVRRALRLLWARA